MAFEKVVLSQVKAEKKEDRWSFTIDVMKKNAIATEKNQYLKKKSFLNE